MVGKQVMQWDNVDRYIAKSLLEPDKVLDAALRDSDAAGLPQIQVSAPQGKLLQLLAMAQNAKNILEIGTLGGYSTIWLARALPEDGRVVTLELEEKHAKVARNNIARAGFAKVVDVLVGPALETLPKLEGPFDFIFIDADKENIPAYFTHALHLSRPGTTIVVDNVIRNGAVAEEGHPDPRVQGVQQLFDMLKKLPRVYATAVQTVGGKGYDGFLLALVGHLDAGEA